MLTPVYYSLLAAGLFIGADFYGSFVPLMFWDFCSLVFGVVVLDNMRGIGYCAKAGYLVTGFTD